MLVFIFGACASQRHRPKPPKNKKGCDCPKFMHKQNNFENNQIYDAKG